MENLRRRRQRDSRLRRRLRVYFGRQSLLSSGYTLDMNARGLAIAADEMHPTGTMLRLELKLPGGETTRVEGLVAWAQRGAVAGEARGAMGIRLSRADDAFLSFVATEVAFGGAPAAAAPRAPPAPPSPPQPLPPSFAFALPSWARPSSTPPAAWPPPGPPPSIPPHRSAPPAALPSRSLVPRLPRFAQQLPLRFGTTAAVEQKGRTVNVSMAGLSLRAPEALAAGSRVFVALGLPGGVVARASAVVVWSRREAGERQLSSMGLRLTASDPHYLGLIEHLVRRSAAARP